MENFQNLPIFFCSEKDPSFGYMSNWFPRKFEMRPFRLCHSTTLVFPQDMVADTQGSVMFISSEQAMMCCKALLFPGNEEILRQIWGFNIKDFADNHTLHKAIKEAGRKIKNFDQNLWNEVKHNLMENILLFKFEDQELQKLLLSTGDRAIFEAADYDSIWGIGLNAKQALEYLEKGVPFPGENLLGRSLESVREHFRGLKN
jgi:ribA/ribD-fused uncharacterized protein